jgi:hypothetical protein
MHAWMSMGNPGANTKGLGSRNVLFPWKLQTSALQISNLNALADVIQKSQSNADSCYTDSAGKYRKVDAHEFVQGN